MTLDPDICWRAFRGRDRRFDGRFFLAVTTTGVYCRPGCPAKLPQRRNVRFYASPAAAESAGFRACLRCRPDSSPGSAAWSGTSATVTRALRLIDDGSLAHGTLEALSARVGVTSRWLRMLFADQVGASPLEVARSRRAHFARRLLAETPLSVEQVARAAGFGGARRLRDAMHATFRRSPAELRGRPGPGSNGAEGDAALALRLQARPPFEPRPLLAFFASRAIRGAEEVDGDSYRRTITLSSGAPAVIEVGVDGSGGVTLRVPPSATSDLAHLVARATRAFDLDADVEGIARHLSTDPRLRDSLRGRRVRVPGSFDPFESGVRALVGQQVSVAAARTILGRMVTTFGARLDDPSGTLTHVFPSPGTLAAARLEPLGLTAARAGAVRAFARSIAEGAIDLGSFVDLDDAVARLTALPGIGAWTAHYIAMRALAEPDAFPAGDLHVRRALAANGRIPTERETVERAESWRPWRAYATIALWTEGAR